MPRSVWWMVLAGFALRLALGAGALFWLPGLQYGDNPAQKAGYLFFDAYRRDAQAAQLAQSSDSLLKAFGGGYESDQYGGLLALSAGVYRLLGSHQPLAMLFLAALAGAMGALGLFSAANTLLGKKAALIATALFLFSPEAALLGAAQMREPFLMSLLAFFFAEEVGPRKNPLVLLATLAGMLFFSPGIALLALAGAAGWRIAGSGWRGFSARTALAGAGLFALGLAALSFSWKNLVRDRSGPFSVLGAWARETARWNTYLLERSSGIVQLLFQSLPAWLALPFVAVYGLLQPVLPAALWEPSHPFWQTLGILRSAGWYALLPFLAFSLFSAWKINNPRARRQWLWLAALTWGWMLIAALRGGGDQWDNPRYRFIALAWLALLAAQAWQAPKTRWFWRIVAVESWVVLVFSHWYVYRYLGMGVNLGIRNTLLLAVGVSLFGVITDWYWEKRKSL